MRNLPTQVALDSLVGLRHQCSCMKTTAPIGYEMTQVAQTSIKVRYCLYARKSTESEERQVLSIDSQIKEMLQLAEKENLEIVTMKREWGQTRYSFKICGVVIF